MAEEIPEECSSNYSSFRDILSSVLIEKLTAPPPTSSKKHHSLRTKRRSKKASPRPEPSATNSPIDDADDIADFTAYIATSAFTSLPLDLQSLSYRTFSSFPPSLQETYSIPLSSAAVSSLLLPLDPSIPDSLITYLSLIPSDVPDPDPDEAITAFFTPILSSYISQATTPPPPPSSTKGKVAACEICDRDWINLTYHHLIPRMVHDKVVKRGWHAPDDLQNVAWLCGACHQFVHRFAGHEELARRYYTVELLLGEEEVQRFAEWVGKLRWKGLGGGRSRRGP